ncbi:MAG: hypothetical protein Q8J78_17550 [Moraxellaceae bacterium]|nr:hypothetical protein [Moraxellaceae bacterium]
MRLLRYVSPLALLALAGCFGGDDTDIKPTPISVATPDSFLTYPNRQAALAAGEYRIVVATDVPGQSGSYQLTITRDDGSTEQIAGNWTSSGGPSATAAGNPDHVLVLARAGGIRIELSSAVNGLLYLLRDGMVVEEDTSSGAGGSALINKPLSLVSSAAYGNAYYAAVDPTNERTTLDDWKQKNGFAAGHDTHVVFRDAFDLGYGRDMYARRNTDGRIAIFVGNYVVRVVPGSSTNYGPINVEAAIAQDKRYFIGTNAIEFSPANQDGPNPNGSIMITKFFTFDASGKRIASADLDGRGVKHMPGMCWACHGGQPLPLEPDGSFSAQSLRSAKLNLLDVPLLEYSAQHGFRRSELEAGLKRLNQYVAESYSVMGARDISNTDINAGQWNSAFAEDLAAERYPGGSSTHDDTAVPPGWQEKTGRPAGVSNLFKKVIEPHCIACHSLQGTTVGEGIEVSSGSVNVSLANAINFSSYEKFISFRPRIIDYVYRRGIMPMSLRNFERFWREPDQGPALLAAYLHEPTLFDAAGKVIPPGYPVAKPGTDRRVKTQLVGGQPVVQLDGTASLFAASQEWAIVSAPAGAALSNPLVLRPRLTAPTDGNYVLSLTVRNERGSDTRQITLTVDSTLAKSPDQLTFEDDVLPLLETYGSSTCISCHSAGGAAGAYQGIPMTWTRDAGLYKRVRERIDLIEPENSRLLIKPTSLNHGGGKLIDVTVPADKAAYDTIVSWIRAGAVCGSDASIGC